MGEQKGGREGEREGRGGEAVGRRGEWRAAVTFVTPWRRVRESGRPYSFSTPALHSYSATP
jgi:hypothetical protein